MRRKLAFVSKRVNSFFRLSRNVICAMSGHAWLCVLAPAAAFGLQSLSPTSVGVVFTDIANRAGIRFVHDNAATPEKYLIETMGAGCAWLDFDQDGFADLYLVNSAATAAYKPQHSLRGALYRNNGDGTFTDVTERAGVGASGLFGMGVAAGDYDNDGRADLFVAGLDRISLYRNGCVATFE